MGTPRSWTSEHLTVEDGFLYYKLRLYVPQGMIQSTLEFEHDP